MSEHHSSKQTVVVNFDGGVSDLLRSGDQAIARHHNGELHDLVSSALNAAVNADTISSRWLGLSDGCVEEFRHSRRFKKLHFNFVHSHFIPLTVFFLSGDHVTCSGNSTLNFDRRDAKYFFATKLFQYGTRLRSPRATQQPAIARASQMQAAGRGLSSSDGMSATRHSGVSASNRAPSLRSGLKRNLQNSSAFYSRSKNSNSQFLQFAASTASASFLSTHSKRANAPYRGSF